VARSPVRVGVIGAGSVAQIAHIPAWKRSAHADLVAVCDPDQARAKAVARKFGIPRVDADFEDLLRSGEVDAVDICAPNHLHAPIAVAALRSGVDVLCERPLATSGKEAESMVQAARKAGRILMCALNSRFRRDVQILRQFVSKGELGRVFYGKVGWLRTGNSYGRKSDSTAGASGVLLDLGVQALDLCLWTIGYPRVEAVSASLHRRRSTQVEDAAVALLRIKGGAVVTLEVSWSPTLERDINYLRLIGSRGSAELDPLRIHKEMHGNLVNVTPSVASPRNVYKKAYAEEIEHFVDCIRRRTKPLSPGEQGLSLMRVVDALYASAEAGREVKLSS
jgi:predicted dehydrogenase